MILKKETPFFCTIGKYLNFLSFAVIIGTALMIELVESFS